MEKSTKNIVLTIISVIGLIVWCVAFFYGINFTNGGNIVTSALLAVGLFIVMVVFLMLMKVKSNAEVEKASAKKAEIASIVIYAIAAIGSSWYVAHFIDVNVYRKADVQKSAEAMINEINIMMDSEDVNCPDSYNYWLSEQLQSCETSKRASVDDPMEADRAAETAVTSLKDELTNGNGYANYRAEILDKLGKKGQTKGVYADVIRYWSIFDNANVVKQLKWLSENKGVIEEKLVSMSEASDFTGSANAYRPAAQSYDENLAEKITEADMSNYTLWTIIFVVVLQFIILMSYIFCLPPKVHRGNGPDTKGIWNDFNNPNA